MRKWDKVMVGVLLLWLMIGLMLGLVGLAFGGDISTAVMAGPMTSAHSECDSDHCLDGLLAASITLDYDLFDSEYVSLRGGITYFHLEYESSYRATAKDSRQDTTHKTTDTIAMVFRGGPILFEVVEPYGLLGIGHQGHLIYGYGVSVRVSDSWAIDAESVNLDSKCDQFGVYTAGIRYSF